VLSISQGQLAYDMQLIFQALVVCNVLKGDFSMQEYKR
jgi:hypothetical protein